MRSEQKIFFIPQIMKTFRRIFFSEISLKNIFWKKFSIFLFSLFLRKIVKSDQSL